MTRIQISSGRGPLECELAVGLLLSRYMEEYPGARIVEEQSGKPVQIGKGRYASYKSIVLDIPEGHAPREGSVQWICPSPVRPGHKRKNWFIEVSILPEAEGGALETTGLDPHHPDKGLVRMETFRSPGKGGQNVNKVETGVRVIHLPTGLTAHSVTARTQAANKKIALTRLQEMIQAQNVRQEEQQAKTAWRKHDQLERGNAFSVFVGLDFRPASVENNTVL